MKPDAFCLLPKRHSNTRSAACTAGNRFTDSRGTHISVAQEFYIKRSNRNSTVYGTGAAGILNVTMGTVLFVTLNKTQNGLCVLCA